MRLAAPLLIYCALLGTVGADEIAPTIDEVAGEHLQLMYEDEDWRVFTVEMASGDRLLDHATGPRAILTLTDVEIQPLENEEAPISIPQWKAMWLTNTFSRGFQNTGSDSLRYLVIEARDHQIETQDVKPACSAGTPLLTNTVLSICRIEERCDGLRIELDSPSWLYSSAPIVPGRNDHHLALTNGDHLLQPADSPVVIVSFTER